MKEIEEIVTEAEQELGLGQVDAMRMLFVALAVHQGWTNARISRYLGISRARVGQKVERNTAYLKKYKLPKLKQVLKRIKKQPQGLRNPSAVAFSAEAWQEKDFAEGVLRLVLPTDKSRAA